MKRVTFWFDTDSPGVRAAFDGLPQALQGLSHAVEYRPLPRDEAPCASDALLRLSLAAGPNRRVVEAVLQQAGPGPDAARELQHRLAPTRDPQGDEVAHALRARAAAARQAGVSSAPCCVIDGGCDGGHHGRRFEGADALPALAAALRASG